MSTDSTDQFRRRDIFARDHPDKLDTVEELKAHISLLGRQHANESILQLMAMSSMLGFNLVDLLALSLIDEHEPETPGQLAVALGMSTGAITSLIDRLEATGFIQRERDVQDRRRVHLIVNRDAMAPIELLLASLNRRYWDMLEHYSESDLRTILSYSRSLVSVAKAITEDVRASASRCDPSADD